MIEKLTRATCTRVLNKVTNNLPTVSVAEKCRRTAASGTKAMVHSHSDRFGGQFRFSRFWLVR